MGHSFRHAINIIVVGIVAAAAAPVSSFAQQKTATQCIQEWQANKAENQAKKITRNAYVAQCRSGPAAAQASPAQPAARTTKAAPTSASRTTTGASPSGANPFGNEAQAKARCGSDAVVWVNETSKVYHFAGTKRYGNTKEGAYMCERDAQAAGDRAAKNEKHP